MDGLDPFPEPQGPDPFPEQNNEPDPFPEAQQAEQPKIDVLGAGAAFGSQALQGALSLPEAYRGTLDALTDPIYQSLPPAMQPFAKSLTEAFVPVPPKSTFQTLREVTQADKLLKEHPIAGQLGGLGGSFLSPMPLPFKGAIPGIAKTATGAFFSPLPTVKALPRLAQHLINGAIAGGAFGYADAINQSHNIAESLIKGLEQVPAGMAVGGTLGTAFDKLALHLNLRQAQKALEMEAQRIQNELDEAAERAAGVYDIGPGEEQNISGQRSGPYRYDPEPEPEPSAYDVAGAGTQQRVTGQRSGPYRYDELPPLPGDPYAVGPGPQQRISGMRGTRPTYEEPTPEPPGTLKGEIQWLSGTQQEQKDPRQEFFGKSLPELPPTKEETWLAQEKKQFAKAFEKLSGTTRDYKPLQDLSTSELMDYAEYLNNAIDKGLNKKGNIVDGERVASELARRAFRRHLNLPKNWPGLDAPAWDRMSLEEMETWANQNADELSKLPKGDPLKRQFTEAYNRRIGDSEPPEAPKRSGGGNDTPKQTRRNEESWKLFVHAESDRATPQERQTLMPLAHAKAVFDSLEAQLQGAIEKLSNELKLQLPYAEKKYTPSGWLKIQKALETMQYSKVERSRAFIETHIKQEMPRQWQFKSNTTQGKWQEVDALRKMRDAAEAAYDKERAAAVNKAPWEKRIKFSFTSPTDGKKLDISLFATKQYRYEFATEAEKAAYDALVQDAIESGPDRIDYSRAGLQKAVNQDPDLRANLMAWGLSDYVDATFRRASKKLGGQASGSILGPFQLVVEVVDAAVKEAQARGYDAKFSEIFPRVLTVIKEKGLDKELNPKMIKGLTGNMVNSDVIRHHSPDFAWSRDEYLAAREKVKIGGREATAEENRLLNSMTPQEIRSTKLKGWTKLDIDKELAARALDKKYKEQIEEEIQTLIKQGAEPGGFPAGKNMLLEVLQQDLEMLSPNAQPKKWYRTSGGKIIGGLNEGIFIGNQKVAQLHFWELLASQVSDSPILTAKALAQYLTNPVAREYGQSLAGKGFQQRLIEDQEKMAIGKWFDAHVNTPIQNFIENKITLGQFLDNLAKQYTGNAPGDLIWKAGTAELPEEIKTVASALIAAERVAKRTKYPGGALQFMSDYLTTAKGGNIPASRRPLLARAEIEALRDRNEKIMHLPAGPIRERTIVQRYEGMGGMAMMLRGVITQARVLTGYADEALAAMTKKDFVGATDAMRKLVFAHIVIAFEAGTYALPPYIWWLLNAADPHSAKQLHDLFRRLNEANPTGRTSKELGPKYFSVIEGGSFFTLGAARQVAEVSNIHKLAQKKPEEAQTMLARSTLLAISGVGIARIGFGGQSQWTQAYQAALTAMKGDHREKTTFYTESKGVKDLLGQQSRKLGQKSYRMGKWDGIAKWLIQGERRDIAEHRQDLEEREEQKGQRQLSKDIKKLPKALGL